VTVPVNIHFDGRGAVYDIDDTGLQVFVNGAPSVFWMTKAHDRKWVYIEAPGTVDGSGEVDIIIIASVKWEHPTSFFLDAIKLEVEDTVNWQQILWDESVERQAIELNPTAALQAKIFSTGYVPVESEFWRNVDGTQYACQAAERLSDGNRRVYYAIVPQWDKVSWFGDPGAT